MLSAQSRSENIQKMSEKVFDLVIVGGGINGAGIARDAASRGMSVALVEAKDFSSGASSRSSKLIHGGIRYLENFEFHLVFEALSERKILFEIAPHLVHPLRFVLPLYKRGRVGMFKMGLGMWLYDALSLFQAPEMHLRMNKAETLKRLPVLQPQELLGSYAYYDAYMDDDRLVLETLRSADSLGALCANYASVFSAEIENGKIKSLSCVDQIDNKNFTIRGKHFVGSVGPWTDILGKDIFNSWQTRLRPSKGIHLTFLKDRLPLSDAVVMGAEDRIVFGIPRHEMVIIGTTDTDYSGDPGFVRSTKEDVDYLLSVANKYFPGANLKHEDIIATYAGVRPLVHDGSATESGTSREHVIWTDPRGMTFVAGGKYTTYRRMAEQTVLEALAHFSTEDQMRFRNSNTKIPLNPLVTEDSFNKALGRLADPKVRPSLDRAAYSKLVQRHGPEAELILERAEKEFGFLPETEEQLWQAEALHSIETSMCLHLDDFVLRRSPLFLSRTDHGRAFLMSLMQVFRQKRQWSDAQSRAELVRLQSHLQTELAWGEQSKFSFSP